jgi:hypothetical protein
VFPYDAALAAAVLSPAGTVPEVLQILQTVDNLCAADDGLKWFNGLYLAVTQAVATRVSTGGFSDSAWLARLDVQFAGFYFRALRAALSGAPCPGCWSALFAVRGDRRIARIQFALAGMNAHINHDLCLAVDATCKAAGIAPQHGTPQYRDYTSVNPTLDSLIEQAKQALHVRLPGDALPEVTHLEDLTAAWNIAAARENAWINAEQLWNLPPPLNDGLMTTIDGFTAVISKALLAPAP